MTALITPDWVRMMARYNAWQNQSLRREVEMLSDGEARAERGAFFGTILGTANHLLWGDEMWLSRFAGHPKPEGGIAQSVSLTPDVAAWSSRRGAADDAIVAWAEGLTDCEGAVTWWSGALGREVSRGKAMLYTHFFNHQTHHRGQLHAMLTAAGRTPDATDLFAMPDPDV
jgi:uncharacterized damage-inducible protein DinB